MEEENKNVETTSEPIEMLENTAPIETLEETPAVEATPVEAPAEPIVIEATEEAAPVAEAPTHEVPAEPAVIEAAPAETAPVVETPAPAPEVQPVEAAPVATETPVEAAPEPTPAEPAVAPAPAAEPVAPVPEEEPKKKGKGGLILIIILLLALGGFAVWYFVLGGNGSKKEEPKKEPEQKEEEKKEEEPKEEEAVDYDTAKAKDLIEGLMPKQDYLGDRTATYFNDKKVNVNDLGNVYIFTNIYTNDFNSQKSISVEEFDKILARKFYSYTIEHKDQQGTCGENFKYNSENNTYEYTESMGGCGGLLTDDYKATIYKVLSAKTKGDDLIVTIGVLFGKTNKELDADYYYDFANTKPVEDGVINGDSTDFTKGAQYEINLKKVDDTYAFVSAEPVK